MSCIGAIEVTQVTYPHPTTLSAAKMIVILLLLDLHNFLEILGIK
jgi:hypothetical protein